MNKHTTVVLNAEGRTVGKHVRYVHEEPKRNLHIHCDVIHPESGEVLAEPGESLDASTPRAQHVLCVVKTYPHLYTAVRDGLGNTLIGETTLATQRGWQQ